MSTPRNPQDIYETLVDYSERAASNPSGQALVPALCLDLAAARIQTLTRRLREAEERELSRSSGWQQGPVDTGAPVFEDLPPRLSEERVEAIAALLDETSRRLGRPV